jgi:hypothetical protein
MVQTRLLEKLLLSKSRLLFVFLIVLIGCISKSLNEKPELSKSKWLYSSSEVFDTLGIQVHYLNRIDSDEVRNRMLFIIDTKFNDTIINYEFDLCNNYSDDFIKFSFKNLFDRNLSAQVSGLSRRRDSSLARVLVRKGFQLALGPRYLKDCRFGEWSDTFVSPRASNNIQYIFAYPDIKDSCLVFCNGECSNLKFKW